MTQLADELAACPLCECAMDKSREYFSHPRASSFKNECPLNGRIFSNDLTAAWNTRPALRAKPAGEVVAGAAAFAHSFVLLNSGNVELAEGVRDYILARTRPAASPAPDSALASKIESLLNARRAAKTEAAADTFTHELGFVVAGAPETILLALRHPAPRADDALREALVAVGRKLMSIEDSLPIAKEAQRIILTALASDAPTDKGD